MYTGVNQKVLPVLSTETLLHIWLSTEYYGFQPSSTAVDTVSLHALEGAPRGFGDLGRRAIYFQGAGEHC